VQRDPAMLQLIEASHPHYILNADKTFSQEVNCLDCIRIYLQRKEMEQNEESASTMYSGLCKFQIDLKTNTVVFDDKPDARYVLVKQDRGEIRCRPSTSLKANGAEFDLGSYPQDNTTLRRLWQEYSKLKKGEHWVMPSIKELIRGLCFHHCEKVGENFADLPSK